MTLVEAGARRDMGQLDAALRTLELAPLNSKSREPWVVRLRYAYADTLEAAGRENDALAWFHRTHAIDSDELTDAADRAEILERRIEGQSSVLGRFLVTTGFRASHRSQWAHNYTRVTCSSAPFICRPDETAGEGVSQRRRMKEATVTAHEPQPAPRRGACSTFTLRPRRCARTSSGPSGVCSASP